MGKTAIVTGGTHKDVSAMGVLALNIKEIIPNLADEFIIFHDGISKKNRQIIADIFPTRFYKFRFNIGWLNKRKNRSIRYFSPMVFCKYECFRLLEEYDCVIWTDYDVVILKDLGELLVSSKGMQIVESGSSLKTMFLQKYREMQIPNFDMNRKGLATPLFVLNRSIGDYMEYYQWCRRATIEYASYIDLPEQCIISLLVQKYHIEYDILQESKYVASPRGCYDGASIIHAAGRPKFWEGLENDQWDSYYSTWLELEGSRYRKPLKEKLIEYKEKIFSLFSGRA